MRTARVIGEWLGGILIVLIIATVLVMFLGGRFGWNARPVLDTSMEPALKQGGLAVTSRVRVDQVKVDDVIIYRLEEQTLVRRVQEVNLSDGNASFKTKGDGLSEAEPTVVQPAQGDKAEVLSFYLPWLGNVVDYSQTPTGRLLFIAIPVGLLVLILLFEIYAHLHERRRRVTAASALGAPVGEAEAGVTAGLDKVFPTGQRAFAEQDTLVDLLRPLTAEAPAEIDEGTDLLVSKIPERPDSATFAQESRPSPASAEESVPVAPMEPLEVQPVVAAEDAWAAIAATGATEAIRPPQLAEDLVAVTPQQLEEDLIAVRPQPQVWAEDIERELLSGPGELPTAADYFSVGSVELQTEEPWAAEEVVTPPLYMAPLRAPSLAARVPQEPVLVVPVDRPQPAPEPAREPEPGPQLEPVLAASAIEEPEQEPTPELTPEFVDTRASIDEAIPAETAGPAEPAWQPPRQWYAPASSSVPAADWDRETPPARRESWLKQMAPLLAIAVGLLGLVALFARLMRKR